MALGMPHLKILAKLGLIFVSNSNSYFAFSGIVLAFWLDFMFVF